MVENTQKGTRLICILGPRSRPSGHDDVDDVGDGDGHDDTS